MQLSDEQIQALGFGQAVPVEVGGREYVLVSRETYDRVKGILAEAPDADTLYDLIEAAMSDDDANDPGLDRYQKYK
jgi:hypothetical protein